MERTARARALGRWIKPVRVQARTQEEGERKKERYTENVREKLRKGRGEGEDTYKDEVSKRDCDMNV